MISDRGVPFGRGTRSAGVDASAALTATVRGGDERKRNPPPTCKIGGLRLANPPHLLHANAITSPITTRVSTPATATPRQSSPAMRSGCNLVCLLVCLLRMAPLARDCLSCPMNHAGGGQSFRFQDTKVKRPYLGFCSSCDAAQSSTWGGALRSTARFNSASRNRPSTTIVWINMAALP